MVTQSSLVVLLVVAFCVSRYSEACGGSSNGGGGSNGGGSESKSRPLFSSSQSNKDIADKNYPDSPLQRRVATSLGDEIPNMRDDLVRRKNEGEGVVGRHIGAWTTGKNWKVDKDNDKKEAENPAKNWG